MGRNIAMVERDFQDLLRGLSLATVNILYYLPDSPNILQCFVWQCMDLPPRYPRIHRFLDYWRTNIEAALCHIEVASTGEMPRVRLAHEVVDPNRLN